MSTSNRIADRAPRSNNVYWLGFISFIPLSKPTRMLVTIPNHPIIGGTTPEVTNTIENASVPMAHKIMANLNRESFALKMVRAESLKAFFSSSLALAYRLAKLRNLQ
jgi:hypothetical protein